MLVRARTWVLDPIDGTKGFIRQVSFHLYVYDMRF